MELSHLRGQRGRYASWDEQRQRETPSLRKGVSVAEAAKRPSIASIRGKSADASSTAGGVCCSAHYPSYATTNRCREPSASTITRCYVGSIRFRGVGTWFLSGLRAEGCACSLDEGYSTKWIAYGSFRPFGSGRIVHGKCTPTCNPCSCCRLEGAFGHRTVCCAPDARNLVFGILESGLSVAGSLVGIFVCIAGVAEYLRKKSLYIAPWCLRKRSRRRRRRISRLPHVRLRERRSWRRVDLSVQELRELRELRRTVLISGSGLEGHTVSALEGHIVSALEGHTVSLLEGRTGSVACQSVVPNLHVELLSCPCCMVDDEDRVFCLNALRSSGPQMRGIPRPGASENLESNLPDIENVPSDDEPSDIPAWGDLFPDEDEDLPDVSPKRPRRSAPSPLAPPDDPDPPPHGGEVVEEPRIPLNSVALRVHQAHGHAPFDRNCASCVSSRGKVPARRLRRKLQKEDQTIGLDFMYFGKLRVLLVVHLSSHYVLGLPAVDLRDKTLEHNFDRFVREIGLTGKTVTVRCDNEVSLLAAAERLTARSTVARAVIDPVAGYRPQSKGGVERMVAVVKQSFWSVWLDLELEVNRSQSVEAETHLPLGGLLWQAALLYTCRCHNLWRTGLNDVTTPIDRVHEQIVQGTRTLAFGSVVFAKTSKSKVHLAKFRGKNLVKCTYLGPVHPRGGGVFACLEGSCEVEVFPGAVR